MNKKYKIIVVVFSLIAFGFQAKADSLTGGINTGGLSTGLGGVIIGKPQANPNGGTFDSIQSVSLIKPAGANEVRYTTDGTEPNCSSSQIYSSTISVTASKTIKAISCYSGGQFSAVATYSYVINIKEVINTPIPAAVPAPVIPVPKVVSKPGDINGDGAVDELDLSVIMASWGQTGTNVADLNDDKIVDELDLSILMANWSA